MTRTVLLLGPEVGQKDRAVAELLQSAEREGPVERHRLYAFETSADHVVTVLTGGTLFGEQRFVQYRGVEQLSRKADVAPLLAYLKRPSPDAILVLESEATKVNAALTQAVGKPHTRIFWELFENQKHSWVQARFRSHHGEVEPGVVDLVLELADNTTAALGRVVDSLVAYCADGRVTTSVVEEVLDHSREESVFSLFAAIVRCDPERAIDIAQRLLATGSGAEILGGLHWQVARLAELSALRIRYGAAGVFAAYANRGRAPIRSKRAQSELLAALERFDHEDGTRMQSAVFAFERAMRTAPSEAAPLFVELCVYSLTARSGRFVPPPLRDLVVGRAV